MTQIPVFLGYWTLAFVLMAGMVGSALLGARRAQQGRYAEHRRAMMVSGILLGAFLLSYVIKLAVLGREPLALWPAWQVILLRVHETFVGSMLLGGVSARLLARRFAHASVPRRSGIHRFAGRAALWCGAAGLVTAGGLLIGMHRLAAIPGGRSAALAPGVAGQARATPLRGEGVGRRPAYR